MAPSRLWLIDYERAPLKLTGHCTAFFPRPLDLRRFRSPFLGCWTEAMLCTLRCDPTHSLPDLSPAGTLISGRHGRLVTQAIRRTSQEVSESKEGKCAPRSSEIPAVSSRRPFSTKASTSCSASDGMLERYSLSESSVNHVLTTMC